MEIPANRRDVAPVQYQATLEEALHEFDSSQAEALYVQRHVAPMIQRVYGVVLQSDIESYYQYRRSCALLWVKASDIISPLRWLAGTFYLPRSFVYHAACEDTPGRTRFKAMERQL